MNQLRIDMEPVAKGRARVAVRNGKAHGYTPSKTVDAEERIRWHFKESGLPHVPQGEPVSVWIEFYVSRPKTCPKSRTLPTVKPDLDNMEKLVLDALNGFAWHDDSQIIYKSSSKRYADDQPYLVVKWR